MAVTLARFDCEQRQPDNSLPLCTRQAMEEGHMDNARIFAENAIRKSNFLCIQQNICPFYLSPRYTCLPFYLAGQKNQQTQYLRMAARVDAVAGKWFLKAMDLL